MIADRLPRISVVTPSLNAGRTIERTLRSIEQQCYPELQLICVDGESTDGTMETISRYAHIVSECIRSKDKNAADAINKGFQRADGDIYCYLNADDEFAPGALNRVASIFSREPDIDVITGSCLRVFADGSRTVTKVPADFLKVLSMRNDIEQPSTFWRAGVHRRLGPLDDTYSLAFDWEWWNRLHTAGVRFKTTDDVLSIYHFSDDNLTSRGGERVINEMYRVTKKYGPFSGYIADVYWLLYRMFDMRGYYDGPFHNLTWSKRVAFGAALKLLYAVFGQRPINSYNWNWASKQVRGLVWYK